MSARERVLAVCLAFVIVSLLSIGVVSATPIRHVIQSLPAIIALAAVVKRAAWAKFAAIPVFLFWFLIMFLIWLFLLGIASIITGRFTPAEVILTITTGASCSWGVVAAFRGTSTCSLSSRIVASVVFAALQVGAMWVSLQPAFSES